MTSFIRFSLSAAMRSAAFLGLSAAFLGCGPSQEAFDQQAAQIRDLREEVSSAAARRSALDEQIRTLEARNADLTGRLRLLGQNVEELEGTRESLEASLVALQARERRAQDRIETFRAMLSQFQSMIEAGRLRVTIRGNRMIVELPEGVLFASGRAEIKQDGQEALKQVAAILGSIADRDFQVGGHTDDRPIQSRRFPSNWELSTARAVNVTRFLVGEGVDARRLSAAGYADSDPVASNDTGEGRAQNRRIEIALMPKLDELPDLSSLESDSR